MNRKLIGTIFIVFLAVIILGIIVNRPARVPLAQQPDGFSGVPVVDTTLHNSILSQGRPIDDLIVNGNVHAIFSQFDKDMARAVPEAEVGRVLASIQPRGKLQKRTAESTRQSPDGSHIYMARYEQRGGTEDITISFDGMGRISGMLIRPSY